MGTVACYIVGFGEKTNQDNTEAKVLLPPFIATACKTISCRYGLGYPHHCSNSALDKSRLESQILMPHLRLDSISLM